MNTFSFDVLIIGGGAAGLRAAISTAEENSKLRIAIVSKVYPVRSHTVSAEGGIAGVLREYDSLENHVFDTIRGGDYLADQDAVEYFVSQAPREIIQMEHWGCPWSRQDDGKIAVRAFGGMSVKRTVYAADKTGFYMLHSLYERSGIHENIKQFSEWFVTKLIRSGDRICGCVGLNLQTGEVAFFNAKAVILATGGACKIYEFTTNGNIKTGDGMALAYEAGAQLKDMEFVQFHPTGLPRTGILITEAARGEGGYLLNNKDERFMKAYLPSKMELGPRDIVSRSIINEIKAGRGFSGTYGDFIHLDIRHLGSKTIDEKLPLVREMALEFAGIDPVKELIPVHPVAHYFMGGVSTNPQTETNIKGLFAAGETACVSMNGANRLGSNSLAECLVFGNMAGIQAARFASENDLRSTSDAEIEEEEMQIKKISQKNGLERTAQVRDDLRRTMQEGAGIERDGKNLTHAFEEIQKLKERAENVGLQDRSMIFNTELTSLLELKNLITVAEATLISALARKESRGSHYRTDFQKRDDENFLKHHLITKGESGMILSDSPVTITKWKPMERRY